jgi:class 3 adenylate cyclase
MEPASLYLKPPAAARFVSGGLSEAESLLGSPLPVLPPPDLLGGQPAFLVRFPPHLRSLLQRFLVGLLRQIGLDLALPGPRPDSARDQADYETALLRILRSAHVMDRRMGLVNLFWLAHSRDVAELLRELEGRQAAVRRAKYSLHPLLSSFYRRVEQAARRTYAQEHGGEARFFAREDTRNGLVESIVEDAFAFTELTVADVDFNQFLAANKRYRLSADAFFEIYTILVRETERRFRAGDRGLLGRVARGVPGLSREQLPTPTGLARAMMNPEVLTYLLADVWQTGTKLFASTRLQEEAAERTPADVMEVFLSLVAAVKRFEVISFARDRVQILRPFGDEAEGEDPVRRGLRLYEFGESAQVVNNAVNASVLFLDLRGFTQTSEMIISERDLTRELYTVFDALVPHIGRFGGTVDKFLGDGIMATFGTVHQDPLDPLSALRTAILCQEALRDLRAAGRTKFRMGVAIHHGRVYVARFLGEDGEAHATVIGRNVNLAGRLSSASRRALDEDDAVGAEVEEAFRTAEFTVSVGGDGVLVNEGIAISRDTLAQLEVHLPLVHRQGPSGPTIEYFDEQIGRRILIRYVGDAKFKGVRSSFPVYAVEFEG